MTGAKADAIFWHSLIRRGKVSPERALEDLALPKKLEVLLSRYAETDAEFAKTIARIAEHRRAAVEELRRLLAA